MPVYLNKTSLFHSKTSKLYKDPESKAEKTADILKANIISTNKIIDLDKDSLKTLTESVTNTSNLESDKILASNKQNSEVFEASNNQTTEIEVKKPSLWQRIINELKHYYDGFKLLYLETKVASSLLKKVLRGETLTRRERKQFTRTSADLFRLVPFSVFIIVPFMEFTLPIFLKLFPNMLPSTFKEQASEQEKLKMRLKAKLEMAKFLQDTLEETALKASRQSDNDLNYKFSEFMKKIRSNGQQPTNEEILKYSSLFENELTLDNLKRQQLIALCQILDVSTLANIPPNDILRFQLRMKIRNLEADDRMIVKEGVGNLTIEELQLACRERGMRSIGLSEYRLRTQLEQWLDLHLNRKIPLSLLLLSRALYLPENLPPEDLIKSTISVLPKSIENATIAKIAEVSGAKVDNKIKLELLKEEVDKIKLENQQKEKLISQSEKVEVTSKPEELFKTEELKFDTKEQLIDKAVVLSEEMVSPVEIKEINKIIENLPDAENKQVKAEIEELKKDVDEYKEDVREVEKLTIAEHMKTKLTETKSAKILSKRVEKLIADMDKLITDIEKESKLEDLNQRKISNTVSIDELIETIKSLKLLSSNIQEKKILDVLNSLDKDKDGKIDDINDVLKVFDLIEQENVKVSKDQLGKILNLLEKEKLIELEEEMKRAGIDKEK